MSANYVFPPPAVVSLPIQGSDKQFAVHRIYCVGRNYSEHAMEMGHNNQAPPFFFMKPNDALLVCAPGKPAALPYPGLTQALHHEVELVAAIGRPGQNIAPEQALQHVFGYAVGLDMTRRDLQQQMKQQGQPWCISKGFDHSAPAGAITPAAAAPHIAQAAITLHVNGQQRQSGRTSQMIWSVAHIIAQLSKAWALQAGDLIYSGTPAGVAAVLRGDHLHASIEGLAPIELNVV